MSKSAGIATRHRVLLVDDDAVSLELLAMLLAHEGHQVSSAHDAGAALELLATEKAARPDVLLVDLQMPGISGGQLAERIRELGKPSPLLLAMSATEAQENQLLAFDGFLLKPLAPGDLQRALKPKKRRAQGAAHSARRTSGGGDALDMKVIAKLLAMMPLQSLHDVIAACIADTRACVAALKNQIQDGDASAISQSAHRIKGAALMIGANHIARLSAGLEMGSSKVAATPRVLDDLLIACSELEGMLLAGKLKKA